MHKLDNNSLTSMFWLYLDKLFWQFSYENSKIVVSVLKKIKWSLWLGISFFSMLTSDTEAAKCKVLWIMSTDLIFLKKLTNRIGQMEYLVCSTMTSSSFLEKQAFWYRKIFSL